MPYINIWEKDLTGSQYDGSETVVFVPGTIDVPDTDENGCYLISPKAGGNILAGVPEALKDEYYITNLVAAGLHVLYKKFDSFDAESSLDLDFLLDKNDYYIKFLTSGDTLIAQKEGTAYYAVAATQPYDLMSEVSLDAGTSASGYYTKSKTGDVTTYEVATGNVVAGTVYYKLNSNREYYKYTTEYVEATDFSSDETYYVGLAVNANLMKSLATIALKRGDCCVIGALTTDFISEEDSPMAQLKADIDALDFEIIENGVSIGDCGTYIALFVSKVDENNINTYPDIAYFKAYGQAIKDKNTWESLANSSRATIESFEKNSIVSKYNLDTLVLNQNGRTFNGIIRLRPQVNTTGGVIWGDRTLLNIEDWTQPKATSFLSIRNMISDIAKRAYQSAIEATYETNNDVTWTNFKGRITNLLDEMVADYKLANYQIFKLPTDAINKIKCEIHIAPYGPVENFDIGIVIENTEMEMTVNA